MFALHVPLKKTHTHVTGELYRRRSVPQGSLNYLSVTVLQIGPRLSGLEHSSYLTVSLGQMVRRDPPPRCLSSRQLSGSRAVVTSRLSPGSSRFPGAGGEIRFLRGCGQRPPPAPCQGASPRWSWPLHSVNKKPREHASKTCDPGLDETPAPTPCPPAWQLSLRAACPAGTGLCMCVDPGVGTQVPMAVQKPTFHRCTPSSAEVLLMYTSCKFQMET